MLDWVEGNLKSLVIVWMCVCVPILETRVDLNILKIQSNKCVCQVWLVVVVVRKVRKVHTADTAVERVQF